MAEELEGRKFEFIYLEKEDIYRKALNKLLDS